MSVRISEDWLKAVGFKWHQFDRQPNKQWCLWLGGCMECPLPGSDKPQGWRFSGDEDFGIELAYCDSNYQQDPTRDFWFCWFRADSGGRYHRFIHVRHLRYQYELTALIAGLTGRDWKPENNLYGSAKCDRCTEKIRKEQERMDIKRNAGVPWYDSEKDELRGRPVIEHVEAATKLGGAK